MERIKKVKDYMSKNIIKFSPEDSIFKVAKVLSKKNISGAPVVKNGKLVGIISESDIVKFMRINLPIKSEKPAILSLILAALIKDHLQFKKELKRISKFKVENVMSKDVITISPEDTILDAATQMAKHDIHRLPVVKNGKLVGIITRADLIKALLE